MEKYNAEPVVKTERIGRLIDNLYKKMPEIESSRATLLVESYKATESLPIIVRRAKAFEHILKNIPITIREEELVVGSSTISPRSCQTFPEFSYDWLEKEFDTVEKRSADPFYISEKTKRELIDADKYFQGKTTSELASSMMAPSTLLAMEHNIFTPGNYFYNGVGHITVKYGEVLEIGYEGIKLKAIKELSEMKVSDENYAEKSQFLKAVIISASAVIEYADRYSVLALDLASKETNVKRKQELKKIADNCKRVPRYGARTFYEACQSFWFVQMLLQVESSGHSISPGRFDQYMYPYYKKDIQKNQITREFAQELIDCLWVKLNDVNKCRDKASAEGFAGYGMFQNLICGGQDSDGNDSTNDLSFMCIEATKHVLLPQPSFSVRVWNGTPHEFLIRSAELTRTGVGLPAYYNDEVIIPSLMNRGLTLADARDYNIIGCVEPQKAGKTEGWHDAAFFNMCRPLELVFSNGMDKGVQISIKTGDIEEMKTFDEFYEAYKKQMQYTIELMVNADNSIDVAHRERCPLPFESSMVDDCIKKGKSLQEGGAIYNFTGPQGFGIANVADGLFAIKKLVFEDKKLTLKDIKNALDNNFGETNKTKAEELALGVIKTLKDSGEVVDEKVVQTVLQTCVKSATISDADKKEYQRIRKMILDLPKFGNDILDIDLFARDVAYTYTKPLETFKNPRGGVYQAGLYPVSANVPLGAQTGATPDGRLANTPVADGVSPTAGRDVNGPTAAANSVSKLDHYIASNGTLFNQKFHPSALSGRNGLENFVALIRSYFDQKGSHMQFNVVTKETLIDAQKNPENYKHLVVRVAGYSALFTTLSRSLQDDIINRTEQAFNS